NGAPNLKWTVKRIVIGGARYAAYVDQDEEGDRVVGDYAEGDVQGVSDEPAEVAGRGRGGGRGGDAAGCRVGTGQAEDGGVAVQRDGPGGDAGGEGAELQQFL